MAGSDSRIYWKIFLPRKWGKWAKIRVFNSLEILLIHFFWFWSITNVCIVNCILAQTPFLGKIRFLRYGPNAVSQSDSTSRIFFTFIYRTKWWKSLIFCILLNIYWNENLIRKCWCRGSHKWVWPLWSNIQDSNIACISRRNHWNKLIFDVLIEIQESLKLP